MHSRPRRVAVQLELHWSYKRHAAIFAGAQRYAQEHGWHSIIDEYADDTLPTRPRTAIPYDGVIARATRKLALRSKRLGVPVVNVWLSSPVARSLPGVFADYAAIGRMRAEHLISRGFRRFAALICEDEHAQLVEFESFQATLEKAGLNCESASVPLESAETLKDWRRTEEVISLWMEHWEPSIGVYVGTEAHGRMVAQMCHNRGWRVPQDVAIVAGWNEETYCDHLHPTLTSVEVGYDRIGYEAARLLDRLMTGKRNGNGSAHEKKTAPEHILLPPEGLVVRESTDFYAVDDPVVAAALEFIAKHSHLQIGQDAVAQAVSTETRTLQRYFRKHLDKPIAAVIRQVRIDRAKRELAQSDRPLAVIAHEVGFGPTMRMYEVFVREVGITPSEFRRQRQLEREA